MYFVSRILFVKTLALFVLTPALLASSASSRAQATSPEAVLFNAANRERAAVGLPAFQWDDNLAAAARTHAIRMAQRNTLSHQFSGEAPLQERAMSAGARFSLIAENVAEGPSPLGLHNQWMNSPPHRANLLDRELNTIGIAVVQSGGLLFAVQDFSVAVPVLSYEQQESQVASQLAQRGLRLLDTVSDARKTCETDRGFSGARPAAVLRYEVSDLRRLPDDIDQKVQSGKYHSAAVGACDAGNAGAGAFARFRIAILLY